MTERPQRARPPVSVILIMLAALASAAGFSALGIWQVQRLHWKLDLIARVDQRLQAAPVDAPRRADWQAITPATSEYLKVRATGRFLHDKETLVQAVTDLGAGFWVVTPLATDDGDTVLINRGFVPPERHEQSTREESARSEETTVTGLLRLTEPDGAFLRTNDPANARWFSRDVAAIAATHRLSDAAPYFIDADATPNPGGWPVGGLTKVRFTNNHLVYALTWFGLALMTLGAGAYVIFDWRRDARTHA